MVAGTEDSARLYACATVDTKVNVVHADRNTPGFMRSPPVVPYIYALESAMDELAVEARHRSDRAAPHQRHHDRPDRGQALYEPLADELLRPGRRSVRLEAARPAPGSMREGDWLIGWGCATALYPTHWRRPTARVRLPPNGEVRVQIAAHEIGNGAYTVIGQLAAERLGVPLSTGHRRARRQRSAAGAGRGRLEHHRQHLLGGDQGLRRHPRTAVQGADADEGLSRARIPSASAGRQRAGRDERQPDDLENAFKRRRQRDRGICRVHSRGRADGRVRAMLYRASAHGRRPRHGEKMMYAIGAEFVEVRINALTREIRVPRIVGAFAAGRIMNTRTARSQYMGGMIWGISSALHEATEIDRARARYVNDNLADYLMPVNADIAQRRGHPGAGKDDHVNPAGVKGIGELANVGTSGRRQRGLPRHRQAHSRAAGAVGEPGDLNFRAMLSGLKTEADMFGICEWHKSRFSDRFWPKAHMPDPSV